MKHEALHQVGTDFSTKRSYLGVALMLAALAWAVVWGVGVGTAFVNPGLRSMTMTELQQTPWAPPGVPFAMWAFAVPLAAVLGMVGALTRAGARARRVWALAVVSVVVLAVGMVGSHGYLGHFPPVFGVGGAVILLAFFRILFRWSDERRIADDADRLALDLRLSAYVFFMLAAWFVCGIASTPFFEALKDVPTTNPMHAASSPIHIMIFFVAGWVSLLASHEVDRRPRTEREPAGAGASNGMQT